MGRTSRRLQVPTPGITHDPSSSSFRARLLGSDDTLALQQTPPPAPDPQENHVSRQLRSWLTLEDEHSVGYGKSDSVEEAPLISQLREMLIETGLEIHSAAIDALVKNHGEIEAKIDDFARQYTPVIDETEALYSNIVYPLSATLCHSDTKPRATIATHLSNEACFKEREHVLRQLQSGGSVNEQGENEKARSELEALQKQAQALKRDKMRKLDQIEAEFKQQWQAETVKMMQTWAE
ncbi:hypothetical protein B0I35DRAFT_474452 [Stachybotrys elegans]|uniref:Uncharacterized protein n=1 Tax=Stachybotrys elegans TaxID=80388 RepID=A0A8K0T431_9HYPO|nr:hypothetical protein B0I35DRAFT_474452 [Stachybotrys elegans]